jgi:aryl-alcohol dehydrogenase-like predicted oxidoreductase
MILDVLEKEKTPAQAASAWLAKNPQFGRDVML